MVAAIAGVVASQPGDSLLSAINKGRDKKASSLPPSKSFSQLLPKEDKSVPLKNEQMTMKDSIQLLGTIGKDLGIKGLFAGIQARMIHVSIILVIQLLAYDFIKELVGLPPTGYH